jgi:hypothetical protein
MSPAPFLRLSEELFSASILEASSSNFGQFIPRNETKPLKEALFHLPLGARQCAWLFILTRSIKRQI